MNGAILFKNQLREDRKAMLASSCNHGQEESYANN